MSLSSSSSSSNLQLIKDTYKSCLEDIACLLADMDALVEGLELGQSADVPSSVGTLTELLGDLEDSLSNLKVCLDVDLPPDYEDPPPEYECQCDEEDEC